MPQRVGWQLAIWVFPLGITQESCLNTLGPDLIWGGGIGLCLILWRGTFPCWLSSMNGDSSSTQILTQHCSAKSETISQLVNLGTTPSRQVHRVQPLRDIETPVDGVGVHATPPSENPKGTVGLY
jgi:hypothetical protein